MSTEIAITIGIAFGMPLTVLAWRNASAFGGLVERCFASWTRRSEPQQYAQATPLNSMPRLEDHQAAEIAALKESKTAASERHTQTEAENQRRIAELTEAQAKDQKTIARLTASNASKATEIAALSKQVRDLTPKGPLFTDFYDDKPKQ